MTTSRMVECLLCPRHCRLSEGQRGDCRVRVNLDGKLQSLVYGNPCSVHVDPIEKKPMYHVLPGSGSFSVATAGCNLHCKYCQNWQISQRSPEQTQNIDLPPQALVGNALRHSCKSIAYTYSDPIIFYEYMMDSAQLAHKNNLLNIMVTAGYIEEAPLRELLPVIDAANIDLKGITDDYYARMSRGTLAPVLRCIEIMVKNKVWVELTNLVVPGWNDKENDIRMLCRWVVDHVGPNVPLHFSRFHPMHQLKNLPATPAQTLIMARNIARKEGLHYVYVGNLATEKGNNTYCPVDGKILIKRYGYRIVENNMVDGKCKHCQTEISGIWK